MFDPNTKYFCTMQTKAPYEGQALEIRIAGITPVTCNGVSVYPRSSQLPAVWKLGFFGGEGGGGADKDTRIHVLDE